MKKSFDTFVRIKNVVVLHLLRQQIDHDMVQVRSAHLLLERPYLNHLDRIHREILTRITNLKRKLRTQGVKVIAQERSDVQFTITYIEKGYRYSHSFRMEPLLAEAQLAFEKLLKEAGPISSGTETHIGPSPVPIPPTGHSP